MSRTLAVDSSVAVAALILDHEAHDSAEQALGLSTTTIAHVAAETYSVLTSLPPPHRVSPAAAAALLDARLPPAYVTLAAERHRSLPGQLASLRVSGGATYDALIALTAIEHDLELVSRDRRAVRTYSALGTPVQLLTA